MAYIVNIYSKIRLGLIETQEQQIILLKRMSLICFLRLFGYWGANGQVQPRYINVKVEHYLLFSLKTVFKIKLGHLRNKIHFLQLLPVFYLIQPSNKWIICFDFRKQNSVLPIVFYVPWVQHYPSHYDGNYVTTYSKKYYAST